MTDPTPSPAALSEMGYPPLTTDPPSREVLRASQRVPWPNRGMMLAEFWSLFATCGGPATGAVVFDRDWQPLVSGFNGSPRKHEHCRDLPRLEDSNGHCLRCLHAEKNCILQAARVGVSLKDGRLTTLLRPCIRCSTDLAQLGLRRIWYRHEYDSDGMAGEARRVLGASSVELIRLDMVPEEEKFHDSAEFVRSMRGGSL